MRPLAPILVVELFPEVRRRLVTLLADLSESRWRLPTVCSGWSVKDVALHLLGVNVANLSQRRDGFGGAFAAFVPPGTDLADHAAVVASLAAWNQAWVVATRRLSSRLLCELLTATGEAVEAHYRGLDPMSLGAAIRWAGPEPAPVWLDLAREYTEQWVHQAQIRDALGLPVPDDPRLLAPVLDTFMRAIPHTLRADTPPAGTCLRVTVVGEAGGEWLAVRHDNR